MKCYDEKYYEEKYGNLEEKIRNMTPEQYKKHMKELEDELADIERLREGLRAFKKQPNHEDFEILEDRGDTLLVRINGEIREIVPPVFHSRTQFRECWGISDEDIKDIEVEFE